MNTTRNLISGKQIKTIPHILLNFSSSSYCSSIKKSPFPFDLRTCIASLQACAHHKNLCKGREIHSWMLLNGFLNSPFSITSLINMYSKCNRPGDALSIFNGTSDPNLFTWNAIIAGFISNGLSKEAFEFYQRMRRDNVIPDNFTFPCAIKACSDLSEVFGVMKIHAELFKIGFEVDPFIGSALINFYLKFDFMREAQRVFEELPMRDIVMWNAMINGYAQIHQFDMALDVFERMVKEGVTPSKFTFTGILSVFAMTGDLNSGKVIHGVVKKNGFESDVVVSNTLIDMYGKGKCVGDALKIFEMMFERDIFSWNSIISVHQQSGDHDGTLRLFNGMRDAGVRPDTVTITTVLPACAHLAALMHGREIHGYMIVNGLGKNGDGKHVDDVYVDNAVLDMYAKCGSLRDALLVFDKMRDRDVASWNIMILGYGMNGFGDEALNMFSAMEKARVKPDEVTFVGVLSACSHSGLLGPGREFLARMNSDYRVIPTVEHYACVVDMLGRSGQLEEAYKLALTMPIESNSVVWRAFLAACRLHGDAAMAEIALKQIFELEPGHCGSYVLISNVYGAIGRHEDVSEVRHTMRQQNVRKKPGCSWIELKTGIHIFISGDRTHPEAGHIYAELDALISHLPEYGYVPDVRHCTV